MSTTLDPKTERSIQTRQEAESAGVNLERLPSHVAIIMDGNGRWAQGHKRPRIEGHRSGIKTVREIVRACRALEIPHLTLYAFSSENWKRPSAEVNALMILLCNFLRREIREMQDNDIRLNDIGSRAQLPASVQRSLDHAIAETASGSVMQLTLALSYGGRQEIADAVRTVATQVQAGSLAPEDITPDVISAHLYTHDMPDPDLLIRTSGEMRISNFLLWQIAYAEIWVTPTLWPDFGKPQLFTALRDYQQRQRRFGGVDQDGAL